MVDRSRSMREAPGSIPGFSNPSESITILFAYTVDPTKSMGVGFCNFSVMQWNTTTPLPHALLQEQRLRESSKVGREEEGLSSNRPELVALRECLEAHDDHIDLLCLTDSEAPLPAIHLSFLRSLSRNSFASSFNSDASIDCAQTDKCRHTYSLTSRQGKSAVQPCGIYGDHDDKLRSEQTSSSVVRIASDEDTSTLFQDKKIHLLLPSQSHD